MIINARVDITWEGVQKEETAPDKYWYKNFEEEIKERLDAKEVEIITIDFYDEDDDELNVDWY